MSIQSRISAFYDLGQFLLYSSGNEVSKTENLSKYEYLLEDFQSKLRLAEVHNPWFTQENLKYSLEQWGKILTEENLQKWVDKYKQTQNPKNVGIIMAGNIPMVGFHDLLAVCLSGHNAKVKTSSKDEILMKWIVNFLQETDTDLKSAIELVDKLQNAEAVIATGSNNTARYFEFYFKNIPHIIRKNRTSIALLDGSETVEDLKNLAEDIFRYFGLGCRNVTKLYLPKGFELNRLFEAFYDWNPIINHVKYCNNYDYHRAIFLMEQKEFLDNNFVMLKESEDLHSPIGVIHYSFYEDVNAVKVELLEQEEKIQCMVGKDLPVKFGMTQKPGLNDYADGIDTMEFLEKL